MIDLAPLLPWLERESRATDHVTAPQMARLAALLDQPPRDWPAGTTVPAGWYVALFGSTSPQSSLGPDGHPPKGDLLPPVPWPRRMFAGRRVQFLGPLAIGDEVTRRSCVTAITPRQGRSGPTCFVTVRHALHTAAGLALVEEQDVVYRPASEVGVSPAAGPAGAGAPTGRVAAHACNLTPGAPLLFRYSAVTYNAHRIHYDVQYARETEGYPALVVNGGLTTLLLWEFAQDRLGTRLRASATRNRKPLFVDRPLALHVGAVDNGRCTAWVTDDRGELAIDAELELA